MKSQVGISRATLAVAVALALTACANSDGANSDEGTSRELAEIEEICGLPDGSLSGKAPIPDMNEGMPKIACAVEEAQKRNLNVGFISNPVDPDAQTH